MAYAFEWRQYQVESQNMVVLKGIAVCSREQASSKKKELFFGNYLFVIDYTTISAFKFLLFFPFMN